MEVGEIFLQLTEIIEIKDLVQGAGTIEIVHFAIPDVQSAGQMHDLRAKRRHACTSAYPNHFRQLCRAVTLWQPYIIGGMFFHMKFSVRT